MPADTERTTLITSTITAGRRMVRIGNGQGNSPAREQTYAGITSA
jgi:hypothetical protein